MLGAFNFSDNCQIKSFSSQDKRGKITYGIAADAPCGISNKTYKTITNAHGDVLNYDYTVRFPANTTITEKDIIIIDNFDCEIISLKKVYSMGTVLHHYRVFLSKIGE